MLRINYYIVALVLWLAFLFNIERLDLRLTSPDISNLSSPTYVLASVMVVLGILLPQWRRVPMWRVQLIAALSFVITLFWRERPAWGDNYTYITLFELMAALISVTLAFKVGQLSADFVETVRSMLYADIDGRVYAPEQAEAVIKREMQSSRRANRPLSVLVLDASTDGGRANLQATAREIQNILVRRQSLVALIRLLPRTLRRTDFVLHGRDDGRLVVVMPELNKTQIPVIADRLSRLAQRRLGLAIQYGVASFPDNGVTFEELVYQAEQELNPVSDVRPVEEVVERRESVTEKLPIVDAAMAVGADS